jgi:hypothetical protein
MIRIHPHTLARAEERGATENEIEDVIRTGIQIPAKGNRQAREKVCDFRRQRQNVYYDQKKVQVVYVMEEEVAITVTVYVFYGKWKV